ncbi:hypothetical protein [Ancylobacter sp. IITR112]|uniref:hypothetical protein n=1 Tax=Ancylobacter sp. IITR112 TaxID=3138073 RepID=UPI00352BCD26
MAATISTTAVFAPPLRLKGEGETFVIGTLDEALAFAERNPHPQGDYEGMIRRLQGAHRAEDVIEAANAFRWWCEANGLLDESVG